MRKVPQNNGFPLVHGSGLSTSGPENRDPRCVHTSPAALSLRALLAGSSVSKMDRLPPYGMRQNHLSWKDGGTWKTQKLPEPQGLGSTAYRACMVPLQGFKNNEQFLRRGDQKGRLFGNIAALSGQCPLRNPKHALAHHPGLQWDGFLHPRRLGEELSILISPENVPPTTELRKSDGVLLSASAESPPKGDHFRS